MGNEKEDYETLLGYLAKKDESAETKEEFLTEDDKRILTGIKRRYTTLGPIAVDATIDEITKANKSFALKQ